MILQATNTTSTHRVFKNNINNGTRTEMMKTEIIQITINTICNSNDTNTLQCCQIDIYLLALDHSHVPNRRCSENTA